MRYCYSNDELKSLYKKFQHCGSPEIIRTKIKEYQEQELFENNKKFIFNYSSIKKQLENELKEIKNMIETEKIHRICVQGFYNGDIRFLMKRYEKLINDERILDFRYNYVKQQLKNRFL